MPIHPHLAKQLRELPRPQTLIIQTLLTNHFLHPNISTRPLTSQAPHHSQKSPETSTAHVNTRDETHSYVRPGNIGLSDATSSVLMPWGWIIEPLTVPAPANVPSLPHRDQPSPPPELCSQNNLAPPPYMKPLVGEARLNVGHRLRE